MTTFVDTSAFYALLSPDDPAHDRALGWLDDIVTDRNEPLITHGYVVSETIALIQARLGVRAVRMLIDDVMPVCDIRYVDAALHERAITSYLAGLSRGSSFVDRTSFELMRAEGVRRAFAFDRDFDRQGFETLP